jgi:hypothetical protein
MKKASGMLVIVGVILFISVIASNLILRNQFNKIDKTDPFWNYTKLATGSFHHIMISGSNETRVVFSPGPNGSVGVLNFWESEMRKRVQASIAHDTLFVHMDDRTDPPNMREWMKYRVLMAISAPEIYSVVARDANLDMTKMKQQNISIDLSGKSRMEFESFTSDFDSLSIMQRDSSELKFEMADELGNFRVLHARSIRSNVQGYSFLNIGHFQIQSFSPVIGDSSAIAVSGGTLKNLKNQTF